MSTTPYSIPVFGGLNLIDDPEEVGAKEAIDLLNVDLDKPGLSHIRRRDGYTHLTAVESSYELDSLSPFYTVAGVKQIVVTKRFNGVDAHYATYDTAGASVGSDISIGAGFDVIDADFCRYGGPSAEIIYVASWKTTARTVTNNPFSWDGTTWVDLGGGVFPQNTYALEVQSADNRMVAATTLGNSSNIAFSDAGDPLTWNVANRIQLTPGDGERITALCSWRELVFAFKETKFFVFTGNTTGPGGLPVFNYRPISSGVGAIGRACAVSSPAGVYFLARRGIYLTTGNDPILISRAIDPIFQGGIKPPFSSEGLNYAAIDKCALHWHAERLYFSYPSGDSTVNDRILVYDPKHNYWTIWDIPAAKMCSFRPGTTEELMFSYSSGLNHIGRHSPAYNDDDGADIVSHYQSGLYQINPGAKTTTRWTEIWGTGTLSFDVLTDHEPTDPLSRGTTLTLGVAPQVARAYHNKSYKGETFSHRLESENDAWSLNRIEHQSAFASQPQ